MGMGKWNIAKKSKRYIEYGHIPSNKKITMVDLGKHGWILFGVSKPYRRFRTKASAMRSAKAYMRSHPNG